MVGPDVSSRRTGDEQASKVCNAGSSIKVFMIATCIVNPLQSVGSN